MKISTLKELLVDLRKLKILKRRIILVTGCFDILHSVHLRFLKKARQNGDILVVGLESDERVRIC